MELCGCGGPKPCLRNPAYCDSIGNANKKAAIQEFRDEQRVKSEQRFLESLRAMRPAKPAKKARRHADRIAPWLRYRHRGFDKKTTELNQRQWDREYATAFAFRYGIPPLHSEPPTLDFYDNREYLTKAERWHRMACDG
jgi:hypothetical protein